MKVAQNNDLSGILIAVSIAVVLISFAIFERHGLDVLQKIFSIAGSFSFALALLTYFNKKKQDGISSTIDQIVFFREKIISEWEGVQDYILERKPDFILSRISLKTPNIEQIKKDFPENFDRQSKLFLDTTVNYPDVFTDAKILRKQVFILNMLEELSLRVFHLNTVENPALESVHEAFVEIVEYNAFALLYMRDVWGTGSIYSSILNLYKIWEKKTTKRTFIIKSLEQHGFITKKQREDFYKMRRDKVGF